MLAELVVCHSLPIAPTRRIALGRRELPVDTAGGSDAGALLLGAVVARHMRALGADDWTDLTRLSHQIERGYRIAQPRLRHRLQDDRVGLTRSRHRAVSDGSPIRFVHDDDKGRPVQQVLGAFYAVADFDLDTRRAVMAMVRRAMRWIGDPNDVRRLVAHLHGHDNGFALPPGAVGDPLTWAMGVLGFRFGEANGHAPRTPERDAVVKRFRVLIRDAHPDQGGESADAATRIAELTEARRILLR